MEKGFWAMAHEYRTDFAMTVLLIYLIIYGAGKWSVDSGLLKTQNMRTIISIIVLSAVVYSCHAPTSRDSNEKFKSELFAVEKEFCAMAQSEGVQTAFVHFAADSAVILRKGKLLKGKEAIRLQYSSFQHDDKLVWSPDFADVSVSGELGYTYGKFTYTSTDSLGNTTQSAGLFHTVWKRQPDGQWRFVWD